MKLFATKENGILKPINQSREDFNKLENRKIYSIDIKQPRNIKHHMLIFALARCTLDNMPESHSYLSRLSPYEFIKALMLEIGQTEKRITISGEVYQVPKSLSFESMPEDKFEPISRAVFSICAKILNITVDELKENYKMYL